MIGDGSFDLRVMQAVAAHRAPWASSAARWVMAVGTTPWIMLLGLAVAVAVVLRLRAYRPALSGAVALLVAAIISALLKRVFDRPRPPTALALLEVGGTSFPSTHAVETAALAVAVLVAAAWGTLARTVTAYCVVLALVLLVGVCMVYLGAHWPTDVLAGWVLGAAVGGAVGRVSAPGRVRRTSRAGARGA